MLELTDAEADAAFAAAMGGSKPLTEAQFEAGVLALCTARDLWVYRVPKLTRSGVRGRSKGWPDLVISSENHVIFRELKTEQGSTSAHQDMWGWRLGRAGLDWALWRPADLDSGKIEAELDALTT